MTEVFDNKFGKIEIDDRFGLYTLAPKMDYDTKCVIDGVGKDAEIITNAQGGKQSKSPMAMHLLDPDFLYNTIDKISSTTNDNETDIIIRSMKDIALYMGTGDIHLLYRSINCLSGYVPAIIEIAKVLQYGAEKYEPNNWRLIPREQHINHALIHLIAKLAGDTQDEHIPHALCRLMMAIATQESYNFKYKEPMA